MTKVYDNATDLITFARSSSGTALRRVGYGENLVDNDDFASGLTSWEQDSTAFSVVGDELVYDASGSGVRFGQAVNFTAGKVYQLTFDATISSTFRVQLVNQISNDNGAQIILDSVSTGANTVVFVANSSSTYLVFRRLTLINNSTLDNISVKEVIFDRATDPLVLFNHPDDIPRIEYAADGSLKGLLIEEQRTNLVTHSEDFSNAAWTKQGSTAVDSTLVTGPDGTLSGRRLLNFNSETGDRLIEVANVSNATLTGSIWVKGEGANVGKDITLVVKRSGGTFVADTLNHTLSSEWVRLDGTFTQLPDNTGASLVLKHPENGNEASEVLIYGAQLEEGTFATSYIPTSGGQKTRDPDIASIPVSAFGYNDQAGTVVVEYSTFHTYTGSPYPRVVNLSQVGAASRTGVEILGYLNNTTFEVYNLGANQSSAGSGTGGGGTVAIAFAQDNIQAAKDGSLVGATDTSATIVPYTDMFIGMSNAFGSNHISGHIKSLKYFPRRLTDAQLQELTS